MATVDLTTGGTTGHPNRHSVRNAYVIEKNLNWATALTTKGSALAGSDVFQVLDIPAGTVIMGAGAEVITAADATAATIDVGLGGGDTYVDNANAKTVGFCAVGTNGALGTAQRVTAADTLDVTLASLTGTLSTGVVRVYAILADVSDV